MTQLLPHEDPLRRCLKVHEWPEADQSAWEKLFEPGDILEGTAGLGHHWCYDTRQKYRIRSLVDRIEVRAGTKRGETEVTLVGTLAGILALGTNENAAQEGGGTFLLVPEIEPSLTLGLSDSRTQPQGRKTRRCHRGWPRPITTR